jgi:hypothetical protein
MTYTHLIELVIQRQMGVVGLKKTMETISDVGLAVGDDFRLVGDGGHDDLERLMIKFKEKYGLVTVMGCKIAVGRKAREGNLALPKILA